MKTKLTKQWKSTKTGWYVSDAITQKYVVVSFDVIKTVSCDHTITINMVSAMFYVLHFWN